MEDPDQVTVVSEVVSSEVNRTEESNANPAQSIDDSFNLQLSATYLDDAISHR